MRAIFVNYVHPEESHIAGVRLKAFADVFANNGHQIILITRTKEDKAEVNISPGNLAQSLRAHDWKAPYHLAIQPENNYWLEGVRNDTLSPLFRKTVVLYAYIFKRGMLAGWVDACRVYYEVLAREFKPQITWGTFGGVDSWEISQKIASQADCPWVMDVKDPWSVFVPRPLQRFVAARYKDASYMTANSLGQAKEAWEWLPKNYTAIYSGFSESALSHVIPNLKNDEFRITFFGSYNEVKLAEFLFALDGWYSSQDKDRKIILRFLLLIKHDSISKKTIFKRGSVVIRNVSLFATDPYFLFVEQKKLIQELEAVLEIDLSSQTERIRSAERFSKRILLKENISFDQLCQISELSVGTSLVITNRFKRIYPYKNLAGHILGYLSKQQQDYTTIGLYGLEKLFQDKLKGEVGYVLNVMNSRRSEEHTSELQSH